MKSGTRVWWTDDVMSLANLPKRRWRKVTQSGVVYRVEGDRIAVLPDSWAAEGKKDGLIKSRKELTILP